LKTQTVGVILISFPAPSPAGSPRPWGMGLWRVIPKIPWQPSSIDIAFLIQLLAAAHDEIRDHDEKTDTRDGPDDRNVFHDGLLSEAIVDLNGS
jgi:hypothetical protein